MKITIEGNRGEGCTTLAAFLLNQLTVLGYDVSFSDQEIFSKKQEKRVIEDMQPPNASVMLGEEREVNIVTKNHPPAIDEQE